MTLSVLFWVLMIVSLIFGFWAHYEPAQPFQFKTGGYNLLIFVLLAILGWAQFGWPVK